MEGSGTNSLLIKGPIGPLEAALSLPSQPATFRAVIAHPHPLYGGSMENPVVRMASERLVAAGAAAVSEPPLSKRAAWLDSRPRYSLRVHPT